MAAQNNAAWCDAVLRAHGAPCAFRPAAWFSRRPAPPYYPNVVTLAGADQAAQLAVVRELIAGGLAGAWAVKDSFGALDLSPLGFAPLFEAEWIWRPAALDPPDGALDDVRWVRVRTPAELAEWEAAWRGAPDADPDAARIFPPALLADDQIVFLAALRGRQIVAGAIANRTGAVAGLSNTFAPAPEAARFWAGCVAAASMAFPGLPLVGYERGADLALALGLGFEAIGPLRVWQRRDPDPR